MGRATPRVVTLGGGHGQAVVLQALRRLECEITAVISVADDGGCSGKLRQELGMPPPGDLRRCLSALAKSPELARRFELRLEEPGFEGRSVGNLALAGVFRETGSLQQAVDWAGERLGCVGRVVPVSESPGVLVVYDAELGRVEGESNVERRDVVPMVAAVHGALRANPIAIDAIRCADLIVMGPGSFYTSTLSVITTGEVAQRVCESQAEKLLIANLLAEGRQTQGFIDTDYLRVLSDHLTIASGGETTRVHLLAHRAPRAAEGSFSEEPLSDGARHLVAPLASPSVGLHDPDLLADALSEFFGLERRSAPESRLPTERERTSALEIEARLRASLDPET
ncbi:MAG: YvcK family protein [Myxococcales bacterium]|nr:YvcK family protein [Myxococcales bacterium]